VVGTKNTAENTKTLMNSPAMASRKSHSRASAYSLIEILVVLAVIGALSAVAVPAFNSIGQARGVTEAAFAVSSAIEQARSEAVARNTFAWLGIREEISGGSKILRVGVFYSKDGSPTAIQANTQLAGRPSLIKNAALSATPDLGDAGNHGLAYGTGNDKQFTIALTFTPAGEVLEIISPTAMDGFLPTLSLTLKQTRGTTELEDNSVTITVDGSTGIPITQR
jgi:prepilin-type N-terminal cleavage/methylation domain-containing protein